MTTEASVFNKKYEEFCDDLEGACPEYKAQITSAKALSHEEREKEYMTQVMKSILRDKTKNPGAVLPGVCIEDSVWGALSDSTHKAIHDYLQILDVSLLCKNGSFADVSGVSQEWMDGILRDWRARMSRVDFKNLTEKFSTMFGSSSENLPPLPERFLKGKLAKLAEDMVAEFRPEDFGLSAEDIAACESDPTRAFEILMQASARNPERLQKVMTRVAKKLQGKMATGEFKPQDLASEAEELMKEFQSHPAFTEMLNSFREAFSFEDTETARRAGRDGDNRLAIARARLRKKLDAKKSTK